MRCGSRRVIRIQTLLHLLPPERRIVECEQQIGVLSHVVLHLFLFLLIHHTFFVFIFLAIFLVETMELVVIVVVFII